MRSKHGLRLLMAVGLAALAASIAAGPALAVPPAVPDPHTWVPNASVETMAFGPDGTVYIGGAFTYIGPSTGGGALLHGGGELAPGGLTVTGTLSAVIPDGEGGYYIGGLFTRIGTVARQNLAHLFADGSLDPAWAPQTGGGVRALALGGGTVYVAGDFENAGGQERVRLAAFDAATGKLAESWNPGADGPVLELAVSGDGASVYAGGIFSTIGGEPRSRLAALSAADGRVDPDWNPGADDYVSALVVSGTRVYIGGRFTSVDGQPRSRLAAIEAKSGHVDPRWKPSADGTVLALAASDGAVYAGGYFTGIDGIPRARLAALDAVTGCVYPSWNPGADALVSALAVRGRTVYAAGSFETVDGRPRARLAALDAVSGRVERGWNPTADRPASAVAVSGDTIYAGGSFNSIGGVSRNRLAPLDANGLPTDWAPNADSTVMWLVIAGDTVYAGGYFTRVNGEPRAHLAALDRESGAVDPYWRPAVDGQPWAIALAGDTVYVGGYFASINGEPRANLAALDRRTGRPTGWNPGADDRVSALAISGKTLYAGGSFTHAGGEPRARLAAFDTVGGGLDPDWKPAADQWVWALDVAGGTVYAGGYLTSIDGQPCSQIAALDATSGRLKPDWQPDVQGLFEMIHGVAVAGDTVYAVGGFPRDNLPRPRLVALDARTGTLDPHWNITSWDVYGSDGYATSVGVWGDTVYVGGYFAVLANQPCRGFAAFRGFPSGIPSSRIWAGTYEATSTVGRLDPRAQAVDTVGSAGVQLTDIAFRGRALYGVGFNDLYRVSTVTGIAQRIGSLGVEYVNALATDPATGVLYAANRAGQLVTVDPESGRCTEIGRYGPGLGSDGDLAFLDGTLYATVQVFGSGNGLLARIDTQTGQATVLGDTGYVDVYGLIGENGFLYGLTWKGEVLSISPLTGQAQFLWQLKDFPGGGFALAPSPRKPLAVLVSGLGASTPNSRIDPVGGDWSLVKRRLAGAGYTVFVAGANPGAKDAACPFTIDSTSGDWTEQARRLDKQLAAAGYRDRPVVLVGHTTGGLIVRAYAQDWPGLTSGCDVRGIVQLGTPNGGSQVAQLGGASAGSAAARALADAAAMDAFSSVYANAEALPIFRLAGTYFPETAQAYLATHPSQALAAILDRIKAVYGTGANDGATNYASVRSGPAAGDRGVATFRAVYDNAAELGAFRRDAGWLLPRRTGSSAAAVVDGKILRAILKDVQAIAPTGKAVR